MESTNDKVPPIIDCKKIFKYAALIAIGLIIGIGISCIYFYVLKKDDLTKPDNNINNNSSDTSPIKDECLTKECRIDRLKTSLSILLYMNESVSPCDNFYNFVCGNYEEVSNTNNDQPFTILRKSNDEVVTERLYRSIRRIDVTTEKFRSRKLVRDLFDLCMDTKIMEAQSMDSLIEIIKKLHGWPVLEGDKWNEEKWRWENVYHEAMKLGIPTESFLLNIDVSFNFTNNSIPIIYLKYPRTKFSPMQLRDNSEDVTVESYYDFMIDMAVKGFKIDKNVAERELKQVFEFEKNLTRMTRANRFETNFSELHTKWPNIDWDTIFNMSTFGINSIDEDEPIRLQDFFYVKFLNESTIPKRVLANYQIWKFIEYAASYVNKELMQIKNNYLKIIDDTDSSHEPWKYCIKSVRKSLTQITDAIFIQDHLDKNVRNEILEIVGNIKEQYFKTINSISWWDESLRKWAITKLNSTGFLVAYPDEAFDNEFLDKLVEDFEIVEGDYLKTVLRFNYLAMKALMSDHKNVNGTGYKSLPSWIDFNAYNIISQNTIQILAGYLQDRFYNKFRPKYMNYATIGSAIGHEMWHCFDSKGIQFNKDGNFFNNRVNKSIEIEYEKKMLCLIHYYNRYKYPKINKMVNGVATADENMADINGVRIAYHAYQEWAKNHGPEPTLPYVRFTTNQLFWISYAHSVCRNFEVKDVMRHSYDTHPTTDIRILGSYSNSPEFASDFNCSIGTKMNPTNKCIFW